MEIEVNGRRYPKPEPTLWDMRLYVVVAAAALMAVALLIREGRAFGLVAGLDTQSLTQWGEALTYIEAGGMALGVAASVIVSLFYWDGHTYKSWEFFALVTGSVIEGFNSYLSATMNTGAVAYLISREVTLGILSIGAVVVWVVLGKVFSNALHAHKQRHQEWQEAAMQWRNKEITRLRKAEGKAEQYRQSKAAGAAIAHHKPAALNSAKNAKERALEILTVHTDISGAELGRRLSLSARRGRQLKQNLLPLLEETGSGNTGNNGR